MCFNFCDNNNLILKITYLLNQDNQTNAFSFMPITARPFLYYYKFKTNNIMCFKICGILMNLLYLFAKHSNYDR